MKNRTKRKISYSYQYIIGNKNREKIINICKTPKNFTELKKEIDISTGTLFHHLKILENAKIINKKEIRKGDKWKRGKEVEITTNSKILKLLKENEREYFTSEGILPYDDWMPENDRKILLDVFKIIKKKGKPTDFFEIRKKFPDKKYSGEKLEITGLLQNTFMNNPEFFLYDISSEGLNYIKENDKTHNNKKTNR